MIIPAAIAIPIAPLYLFTNDQFWITFGLWPAGRFRRRAVQPAPELSLGAVPDRGAGNRERFLLPPGRDFRRLGGAGPGLFRDDLHLGYAVPMLIGTVVAAVSVVIALLLSPETKGKVLVAGPLRGVTPGPAGVTAQDGSPKTGRETHGATAPWRHP